MDGVCRISCNGGIAFEEFVTIAELMIINCLKKLEAIKELY